MLVEKRIRRLTLRSREGMTGIGITHREPVLGLEHLAIHRNGRREAIAHARHLKVRRIMQWRVHKHRARCQSGQHFGEIEGNLRRHIAIQRLDARHVVTAAPGAHVAPIVLREDIEPAARHHRLHPLIKHGQKQCIVPAERVPDHADGLRIDKRQRLQHIHAAPVIDNALHRRAVIFQRVRIGLVFRCVQQRVVENETNVSAFRQLMRIGAVGARGKARRRVLALRGTSWQADHRRAVVRGARAIWHQQPSRHAVAFLGHKRHMLPRVVPQRCLAIDLEVQRQCGLLRQCSHHQLHVRSNVRHASRPILR